MKKRIYLLSITLLLLLTAALAVRWADRDGRFDLLWARIDNSGPVDSSLVADILKPFFGGSLLSLDVDSVRCALGAIDGLRCVSVTVSLPHTIIVEMTPERPAALVIAQAGSSPVAASGKELPCSWADPSLPLLYVEGAPGEDYLKTGLDLLLKRGLNPGSTVTVCDWGILVVENGVPVMLDGERAPADWKTWQSIRGSVRPSAEMVDMRYNGQAVIRTAGGAEV